MEIVHLFLSPGHNYFGHFGKPPGRHAVWEVSELDCVAGRGVRGDRFFDYRPDYPGQITFFSAEVHEELCASLGVCHRPCSVLRRNVVVRGLALPRLIGRRFQLQGVTFEGMAECKPCFWMDQAIGPGAEAFLRGRGGLRARICSSGVLHRGSGRGSGGQVRRGVPIGE